MQMLNKLVCLQFQHCMQLLIVDARKIKIYIDTYENNFEYIYYYQFYIFY